MLVVNMELWSVLLSKAPDVCGSVF